MFINKYMKYINENIYIYIIHNTYYVSRGERHKQIPTSLLKTSASVGIPCLGVEVQGLNTRLPENNRYPNAKPQPVHALIEQEPEFRARIRGLCVGFRVQGLGVLRVTRNCQDSHAHYISAIRPSVFNLNTSYPPKPLSLDPPAKKMHPQQLP